MRGDEAERERGHVFCVFEERDRDVSGERNDGASSSSICERERRKMTNFFFSRTHHSAGTTDDATGGTYKRRRFSLCDAAVSRKCIVRRVCALFFFRAMICAALRVCFVDDVSLRAPRGKED